MTSEELKNSTVAQIVTKDIGYAHIFKKYNIDFCCGGGVILDKACEKHSVSLEELTQELLGMKSNNTSVNFNKWPLPLLVDYIVSTHHEYVTETLPILEAYAEKVAKVHGQNYRQLLKINQLVKQMSAELSSHLKKEEQILFPYIKKAYAPEGFKNTANNSIDLDAMKDPIKVMMKEHDDAGDMLKELAQLTNNYTPPLAACNTFKALYHLLHEFEKDLHLHVHLENNILFPKALKLEQINSL